MATKDWAKWVNWIGSAVEEKRSASRQHKGLLNGGRSCWRSMPAPSRDDSIRGTVRERFLNVVREVQPANGWKVVVVDAASVKLLSCAVRTLDILEEGVSLVENLEIRRQPMPTMEAIYLVEPTESSIAKIKEDFADADKCMYAAAHVYLTSHLANDLVYSLKQAPEFVARCRTLRELGLEFFSPESQCFHLGLPDVFNTLYSPMSIAKNATLHTIVERLHTVCITLGEKPNIRYMKAKETGAADASETVAKALYASLSSHHKQVGDKNAWWQPDLSQPATLLILDRSFDALSPLLHEYTYQAMVHDLISLDNGKYAHHDAGGKSVDAPEGVDALETTSAKGKAVALDEDDSLWVQLRHMHIADAINHVIDDFNVFVKDNKAAAIAKGEVSNIKDLSEALKSMPQYKEQVAKYSLHIDLTKHCMAEYEKQGLEQVSTQEQNMATKADVHGKPVDMVATREAVEALVQQADTPDAIKLRLIMIFVISQESVDQASIDRLILAASLRDPYAAKRAVANLAHLRVRTDKPPELPKSMKDKSLAQMGKMFPFVTADRASRGSDSQPKDSDVAYDLSRYRPPLQYLMRDALDGKLPEADFPFAGEPARATAAPSAASARSGRGGKASWASPQASRQSAEGKQAPSRAGPRLLVVVLGGMCYSEVRAAYELTKKYDRQVCVGSSELVTPQRYLDLLTLLSDSSSLQ